mgnify:CR=1 FL=1
MTKEIQWLLERADESLQAAELTLNNRLFHSSVSKAYYAMFYAAQALVLSKGKNAATHKGVLTQFSALFIKTGEVDRSYGVMLARAFAARGKADYEIGVEITEQEAGQSLADARSFLSMASRLVSGTNE